MLLTSKLLASAGFRHGFFTRQGGVSEGSYASLNFSSTTGDDEARVRENFARAARALGVTAERIYLVSQVHGAEVRAVTGREAADEVRRWQGDALVASAPDLACGVRVADCVPILVVDRRSGAAAAVHSGWRGAVADVTGRAVEALRSLAGPGAELLAAVGPHISAEAFEVGDEVAEQIEAAAPGLGAVRRAPGGKPHGDLRRLVDHQLRRAGVAEVDHVEGCTLREPERFYSFRRDGARSGRHLAAVVPRLPA